MRNLSFAAIAAVCFILLGNLPANAGPVEDYLSSSSADAKIVQFLKNPQEFLRAVMRGRCATAKGHAGTTLMTTCQKAVDNAGMKKSGGGGGGSKTKYCRSYGERIPKADTCPPQPEGTVQRNNYYYCEEESKKDVKVILKKGMTEDEIATYVAELCAPPSTCPAGAKEIMVSEDDQTTKSNEPALPNKKACRCENGAIVEVGDTKCPTYQPYYQEFVLGEDLVELYSENQGCPWGTRLFEKVCVCLNTPSQYHLVEGWNGLFVLKSPELMCPVYNSVTRNWEVRENHLPSPICPKDSQQVLTVDPLHPAFCQCWNGEVLSGKKTSCNPKPFLNKMQDALNNILLAIIIALVIFLAIPIYRLYHRKKQHLRKPEK